jgi:hypothetical protein
MHEHISVEEYNKVVAERDALLKEIEQLKKEVANLNNGLNSWKLLANICRDEVSRLNHMVEYKTNELLHTEPTPADYNELLIKDREPWDGKLESEKRREREHEYELHKADRFYEDMAACISYKCSPMGQYMRNEGKEYE